MAFIDQLNSGMQKIMLLRTPEVEQKLPEVEAMAWEDRVHYVQRGYDNVRAILKSWDKFAAILIRKGVTKQDAKRRMKQFKAAKVNLDRAMRLADRDKIPEVFHAQMETAFNTLVAWFKVNMHYFEEVLVGPKLKSANISEIQLPDSLDMGESIDAIEHEIEMDGPADGREADKDADDLLVSAGRDFDHG